MNETPDLQIRPEEQTEADSGVRLVKWIRTNPNLIVLFFAALIITTISSLYYFGVMLGLGNPGFTLDDSWIHLQFARTIFEDIRAQDPQALYGQSYYPQSSYSHLTQFLLSGESYSSHWSSLLHARFSWVISSTHTLEMWPGE